MPDLSNFNMNDFNNSINLLNQSVSCGPSCMNEKKAQELQQNLLAAEKNVVSAPQQLITAKKDYVTFTQGQSAYNVLNDSELQNQAIAIANDFQKNFNNTVKTITENINSYQGILINFDNIYDLYKKYKNDNADLENLLKMNYSDTLTNDRKSYYEDQGINRLKLYFYFFLFIYIFVVVVFILSIFLVKTNVKLSSRILILILLILYPFVSYWIIHTLYKLFHYVKRFFPNSVYIKDSSSSCKTNPPLKR